MATKRTYGEACGIPRALDRVGERWALMVVRELLLGPKRFTDLRTGLPAVSPDVLAQRLRELDEAGVVRKRKLPPPAASQVYELTDWGFELEPVVLALGRWGARAPERARRRRHELRRPHHSRFMTLFDPELAEGFEANVELRLDEDRSFAAGVADGRFEIERGEAAAPDATIETDPGTLLAADPRPSRAGRGAGARARSASPATSRSRSASSGCSPCPSPQSRWRREEAAARGAKSRADGRRHPTQAPGPVPARSHRALGPRGPDGAAGHAGRDPAALHLARQALDRAVGHRPARRSPSCASSRASTSAWSAA